jgi:hypothetical protein
MRRLASTLAAVAALSLICSVKAEAASPTDVPGDKPPCARWDMSGSWAFYQSDETTPVFQLDVTDTGLQGTGSFWYLVDTPHCPFFAQCGKDAVTVTASVDGTLSGNELELTAYWTNGMIGVYSGKINAQGRIEGTTFDRQHPQTMASWYSTTTAKCLDGATGSGGVASTSSALKTPPPEKVTRVARDTRVPAMKTTTYTAVPVCDAATTARTQNSPAAATLDGMCRSSQIAAATSSVVRGPAPATAVTPVQTNTTAAARARVGARVPPAAGTVIRSNPAPVSGAGAAVGARVAMPYSLLQKDSRFGFVAAPGMALGVNQPANSIQVRVSYPKQYGYKEMKGPAGILGPSSCDDFSVNAKVGDGSTQQANPTRISSEFGMAEAGDSYICSYLVSDLPMDQPVNVHVDVSDRVGPWLGNGLIQPPPGQQRVIANGSQTITLKAIQNRARLNYDMSYAPLPGR